LAKYFCKEELMRVEEESIGDDSDSCASDDGIDLKEIEEIFKGD